MKITSIRHPKHPYHFHFRVLQSITIGIIAIILALIIGTLGYAHFEDMTWIDAFANASMILSGMGPLEPLKTNGGKLFAGFYALFSGLFFILIIAIIFSPFIQKYFTDLHEKNK